MVDTNSFPSVVHKILHTRQKLKRRCHSSAQATQQQLRTIKRGRVFFFVVNVVDLWTAIMWFFWHVVAWERMNGPSVNCPTSCFQSRNLSRIHSGAIIASSDPVKNNAW